MKKILGLTSIRSDYDLMSGLYRLLADDPNIDFRLLVTGAHLSRTYGFSVDLIRADGFTILGEIECLIDGDSPRSRLKSASIFLQTATDMVANWRPDLILFAGDREDVLVGGMIGTYLQIPTIHFFGGDHEKDGHADTAVRHATSKLATAHVVSTEEHRQRLIRMGEAPGRIFLAGSIALDKFVNHIPLSPEAIAALQPKGKRLAGYALVIYHPVDAEIDQCGETFEAILLELEKRKISVIASYPNTDPGNSNILEVINRYQDKPGFWFYRNLDRQIFLSIYKNAIFIIGNSSSGIQEAASIPLAAINVGLRQRGRMAGRNVVFCDSQPTSIAHALDTVLSEPFQRDLASITNPYGDGHSCEKAFNFIIGTDFSAIRAKVEDPLEFPFTWRPHA